MIKARLLSEVAPLLNAKLVGDDASFSSVVIDARLVRNHGLFIAFEGERVDGHDFLEQAAAAGAAGAIVTREVPNASIAQLVVDDAVNALHELAKLERTRFAGPVIGITGSAGKTTVKGMVTAIMQHYVPTQSTKGNFNNHLGMPLTLLAVEPHHKAMVLEMGANGLHEIGDLCAISKPNVGVVTNALQAHVEGFGSLEGVVQTKGEMYDALPKEGVAIINEETEFADGWRNRANCTRVNCSTTDQSDWYASHIELTRSGCYQFRLNTPKGSEFIVLQVMGRHNVLNAVLAGATAGAAGASLPEIKSGLEEFLPEPGRVSPNLLDSGALVIDDTYNANPGAVKIAIDLLAGFEGTRTLVLGDMAELGPEENQLHADVGAYAREQGIDRLVTIGRLTKNAQNAFGGDMHFDERSDAQQYFEELKTKIGEHDTLLVKGSRSAATEVYVKTLMGAQ